MVANLKHYRREYVNVRYAKCLDKPGGRLSMLFPPHCIWPRYLFHPQELSSIFWNNTNARGGLPWALLELTVAYATVLSGVRDRGNHFKGTRVPNGMYSVKNNKQTQNIKCFYTDVLILFVSAIIVEVSFLLKCQSLVIHYLVIQEKPWKCCPKVAELGLGCHFKWTNMTNKSIIYHGNVCLDVEI